MLVVDRGHLASQEGSRPDSDTSTVHALIEGAESRPCKPDDRQGNYDEVSLLPLEPGSSRLWQSSPVGY